MIALIVVISATVLFLTSVIAMSLVQINKMDEDGEDRGEE